MHSILHLWENFIQILKKIVKKQMYQNKENSFRKHFSLLIIFHSNRVSFQIKFMRSFFGKIVHQLCICWASCKIMCAFSFAIPFLRKPSLCNGTKYFLEEHPFFHSMYFHINAYTCNIGKLSKSQWFFRMQLNETTLKVV